MGRPRKRRKGEKSSRRRRPPKEKKRREEYGNGSLNCLQKPWKRKGWLGLCMGGGNLGVYGPSSSSPPHPALCQQSSPSQEQRQISRKRENKSVWVPLFAVAEDIALPRKKTIPSQQAGGGGGQFSGASAVPSENLGICVSAPTRGKDGCRLIDSRNIGICSIRRHEDRIFRETVFRTFHRRH